MTKKSKKYSIGIDIGGTKISAVLYGGEKVIADDTLATPKDTLEHFYIMLNALVETIMEKALKDKIRVAGIGIGVAGVLNYSEKRVLYSPSIPIIDNEKIAEQLEEKFKLPALMDNDTNCFTRAEALIGAGRKYGNIYGIILGTGIGGAWWINGEVYRGAHGGAGEPGAMIIDFDNKLGLEDSYHRIMQRNPAAIAEEAYRGDLLAEKVYQEFGEYLGLSLANIVNIVDPEVIIIGGGVSESGDLFLKAAKKIMQKYIVSSESRKTHILKGKLGKHAGAIGAALLVE
jgi:glucokinase